VIALASQQGHWCRKGCQKQGSLDIDASVMFGWKVYEGDRHD